MPWSNEDLANHIRTHSEQYPDEQNVPTANSMAQPVVKKRTMNSTERRYEQYVLEPSRMAGEVHSWMFEGLRFRLAEGSHYTPDFNVWHADGRVEQIEIKGGIIHEASVVRVKVARERFPWTTFRILQWKGGAWLEKSRAPGSSI